jgi:Sucrase/ferredoxin-like
MAAMTCSASSLAAGESLAGTATRATRWLLIETPGVWGRDVEQTELSGVVRRAVERFDGRALMIRRPDRRDGDPVAFVADVAETGGVLRRLDALDDLESGQPVDGPLVLVCCHGRRDACCARTGTAVFAALAEHVPADRLWQSSHLGGHRFAANVLALPDGILLGRVTPEDAARVAHALAGGTIPLDRFRGRTFHAPEAQAADAAVRERLGLEGGGDVAVLSAEDGCVRLATPAGEIEATVSSEPGPDLVESCGADAVASVRYSVRW